MLQSTAVFTYRMFLHEVDRSDVGPTDPSPPKPVPEWRGFCLGRPFCSTEFSDRWESWAPKISRPNRLFCQLIRAPKL